MLNIYGSPLSSPTNKVRYVANYLGIPYQFHRVNLAAGEHQEEGFLKINPLAKIPAIDDAGFKLGESNAIIRYLADKQQSPLYPHDLKERALVDQWLDHAAQHIAQSSARLMLNLHLAQLKKIIPDERAIQDARQYLARDLPAVEQQLSQSRHLIGNKPTLADIALLAALDVGDLVEINLTPYPHINAWRNHMMQESFYQKVHSNYCATFKEVMKQ